MREEKIRTKIGTFSSYYMFPTLRNYIFMDKLANAIWEQCDQIGRFIELWASF